MLRGCIDPEMEVIAIIVERRPITIAGFDVIERKADERGDFGERLFVTVVAIDPEQAALIQPRERRFIERRFAIPPVGVVEVSLDHNGVPSSKARSRSY